ncbi:MAG: helix-turn-helix transcriptional regulator [Pseudomonadota bacterium]
MARQPHHPEPHQIGLSALYDALSDPARRRLLLSLAREGELNCSSFGDDLSKTLLSYHLARMREAGLTRTRAEGTSRYVTLRTQELQERFPGWLDVVLASIEAEQAEAAASAPSPAPAKRAAAKRGAPARRPARARP